MRAIVSGYDTLNRQEEPVIGDIEPQPMRASSGGNEMTPPNHSGWDFFKSPQFSVIGCTLVVVLCGVAMYKDLGNKLESVTSSLNSRIDASSSKVDAVRLEMKSDIQALTQRTDSRFDQVSARFDAVLTKMDADGRELRALILNQQRPQQQR
ncbi:hypothetical protein RirG_027230 [Rhizophagus irregularis DAOM 197198w]|uniref:Uncharacterized protein n=1 Tax=Rhizophagus irregularis (strain DAOM 197198w) TaxID=1432141 RepID=A0A015LWI4_RHIIW|nr:hypothetical protein RirG_027230 [Rhizophagus irregularis DAOM 197198w]